MGKGDTLGWGNTAEGLKNETSKTFSTTYDIGLLHYTARRGRPGITFFSSCAPSAETKRIRGQHIPRHAYHSWANVMIRAINQGCGRDTWCMLRSMMGRAHGNASYVPQWKEHRGITIMGSDDKHEFYTIMGNYIKRVKESEGAILFFPEMFCAFAVGANSDPTNRLRGRIQLLYDNFFSEFLIWLLGCNPSSLS